MKEIEFRGLVEDTEESIWVYGYYYEDGDKESNIQEFITENIYPVIYKTVGQYIGLKDKNGKKIYEGDILATSNNDSEFDIWTKEDFGYTTVLWDNEGSCFIGSNWIWDASEDSESEYSLNCKECGKRVGYWAYGNWDI